MGRYEDESVESDLQGYATGGGRKVTFMQLLLDICYVRRTAMQRRILAMLLCQVGQRIW